MSHASRFVLLFCICGAAAGLPAAGATFDFALDKPAVTSAGVYTPDGRLVRVLWTMQKTEAGKLDRAWDGKDDAGRAAPAGEYRYRVVVNGATYQNVGAIGNSGRPASADNHTPAGMESVAVDVDGAVYTANGWDEAGHDFKKWDASGKSVYHANFQIRNGKPNGAPYSIAVDEKYLYCGVGGWANAPWNERQQVQRFRRSDGKAEPFTGKRGLMDGHIQIYEWPSKQIPPGTSEADAALMKSPLRAVAVHGDSLYVADALKGRVLLFDKVTGEAQGEFAVATPTALAVDREGRVFVGHEHRKVSVFVDGKLAATVGDGAAAFGEVESLVIGGDDRLYVADSAAGKISVYTLNMRAVLQRSFGQKAVPGDRAPDRFFRLRGVAVDKEANLFTIQNEPYGGARIAKWSPDGRLQWEQFGCEFVSLGNYGRDKPDAFYSMTLHQYALGDRAAGAWVYQANDAPLPERKYTSDPHGVPRVLKVGDGDFFFQPAGDGVQVYRITPKGMRLAALVGGRSPAPDGTKEAKQLGQWTWSNAAASAEPKAEELNWFRKPGEGKYSCFGMDVDAEANIWFANTQTQSIWTLPLGAADARGNPTYDWKDAKEVIKDASSLKFEPTMVQRADDGSIYAFGWSARWPQPKNNPFWMGGTTLARFEKDGVLRWAVKLPETCVGLDAIPGGGCMVGSGKKAAVYHYSTDGLLIGQMEPGPAMNNQSGWLDNHASVAVNRDPRDKFIDVFTEDDFALRIGWYRVDDRDIHVLEGMLKP